MRDLKRLSWLALAVGVAVGCSHPEAPRPPVGNEPDLRAADPAAAKPADVMIATQSPPSLVVTRVSRAGLTELGRVRVATAFAWIDGHTLVALDTDLHATSVRRIVDGKLVDTLALPGDLVGARMMLTQAHEAWVSSCDPTETYFDGTTNRVADCGPVPFWRVAPGPLTSRTGAPPQVVPYSVAVESYDHLRGPHRPLPPAAASTPPHVALTRSADRTRLVCDDAGRAQSEFPTAALVAAMQAKPFAITAMRWVRALPPVYEVTTSFADDVATNTASDRTYFRACVDLPLDDFAALGGSLWASWDEDPQSDANHISMGTWTLWDLDRSLGDVRGYNNLRVNTPPAPP